MELDELPLEMLSEILMQTPLDTLLYTCTDVSKGWKEMIYDSTFFPFYLKRNATLFGFYIQDIHNKNSKSQFIGVDQVEEDRINKNWPSGDIRILSSCNLGLVCCEKRKDRNYQWYVAKPATGQWKALPNPKLGRQTVGVAIVVEKSKPLRFKIVRLSKMEIINMTDMMEYACEIFDSKTWHWGRTQSLYLPYCEFIDFHQSAITAAEFVYWKTSSHNVVAFHIKHQHFKKFSLPETRDVANGTLVQYQGGLGFSFSTRDGNMQLWVTNSRDKYEWRRKMDVDIRVLQENSTNPTLVGFCNSGTSFMKAFNEVIFHKAEDGSFMKKKIDFELRHASQVFQFCSDGDFVDFKCVDRDD